MHGQVYWYRNKASGHAGISKFKSDWVLMDQELVSRELLCTTRLFTLWIVDSGINGTKSYSYFNTASCCSLIGHELPAGYPFNMS
jgi:hypothetical protein